MRNLVGHYNQSRPRMKEASLWSRPPRAIRWFPPAAKRVLQDRRGGQDEVLFKRPSDNLNANRKSGVRLRDRNCRAWETKHVERLRVAKSLKDIDRLAIYTDAPLAMLESADRSHRTDQ